MTSLMLVGATGAVGARALTFALADPRVDRVVALTRRPLADPDPEIRVSLDNRVVDFDALAADSDFWSVDAVACALGTTRRIAGSAEEFRRIDHDIPVRVGQLARAAGADSFALVSSVGADAGSRNLYLRVKGETERDLQELGFAAFTAVRPSGLYGGARTRDENIGDRLVGVSRVLSPCFRAGCDPCTWTAWRRR
ncbi:NAD(P)H-binding protein [Nocardioides alcanivorans]|uniref:NAD(P)H-binding protein n=1 Tax=Nocardioides alcanivorans TaxID=2897352 RepID=UPI001F404C49|nr:NAD(P)H-binding protein [Nocardioides alcanivorans]